MRIATMRRLVCAAGLAALAALGVAGAAADDEKKPAPEKPAPEVEKPAPCPDCKDGKECEKCAAAKKAAAEEAAKRPAASAFTLEDTHGKEHSLSDYRGKVVVLEWINHGCPYVKKHYDSGNMQDLQSKYAGKGVAWLSICSSAEGKQGHMSPKEWNEKSAALKAAPTAVLLDADGTAGRAYGAKVTPQMFVLDKAGAIAYRGAIDDNPSARPADAKTAKNLVAEALDALLAGKEPPVAERAPYG